MSLRADQTKSASTRTGILPLSAQGPTASLPALRPDSGASDASGLIAAGLPMIYCAQSKPTLALLGNQESGLGLVIGLTVATVGLMAWGLQLRRRLLQKTAEIRAQQEQGAALEHRFSALVENAPDLIVTCDFEGRILSFNKAGERLTGFTRDQIIGTPLDTLLITGRGLADLLPDPTSSNASSIVELQVRTRQQETVPVEVRWKIIRIKDRPSEIQFVARDIRERRQAQDALRQSEEVYRDMFEKNRAVKLLIHPGSGEILDANAAASRFYGLSLPQLRRTRFQHLSNTPEAQVLAILDRVLTEKIDLFHLVQSVAQQRLRHVEVYGCPLNVAGRTLIFCIVLDVTEQVLATQAIQRANEALELRVHERTTELQRRVAEVNALNEELEAFSYSVSHDLRSPLRHISGFTELLAEEERGKLGKESTHCIQQILRATRRMSQLIEDLLELSRLGRVPLKKGWCNAESLIQEVIDDLTLETRGREVRWIVRPIPQVYADASLLKQVLINYINNAVKYSRPRKVSIIEIGCQKSAENAQEIVLYCRDNGVGFDMKYAGKLFGAFQRLHPDSEFEGTGIGLANVRRIINRHGGRTWAESESEAGATFYFSLPAPEGSGVEAQTIQSV